jgi:hypothetical protein
MNGVIDAGSRLLFKFRSGTHGLNEELSRHRGRVEGNIYMYRYTRLRSARGKILT